MKTIEETEAESIWVTHGYTRQVVEHLRKNGYDARVVQTQFHGELENEETDAKPETKAADVISEATS